jgi:DNA-directed RNA polymerase subunit beta
MASLKHPIAKYFKSLEADDERLEGRTLREEVVRPEDRRSCCSRLARWLMPNGQANCQVRRAVASRRMFPIEFDYLSADAEDKYVIAQANAPLTDKKEFVRERVSCRYHSGFISRRLNLWIIWMLRRIKWWVSAPR